MKNYTLGEYYNRELLGESKINPMNSSFKTHANDRLYFEKPTKTYTKEETVNAINKGIINNDDMLFLSLIAAFSPNSISSLQIKELLKTKYRTRLGSEDGVRKTFAALQRKGFSYGDIRAALSEYSEKLENCEEW